MFNARLLKWVERLNAVYVLGIRLIKRVPVWLEKFKRIYDLLVPVVKAGLFLIAVALVVWAWHSIDWSATKNKVIAQYTPFSLQSPTESPQVVAPPILQPPSPVTPPKQPPPKPPVPPPPPPPPPPPSLKADYLNVYQFGQLVFTTDKPYEIKGDTLVFDKLLVKGKPDYSRLFMYAGVEIKIDHINQYIGLLVSGGAVEGPLLLGVYCTVVRR